MSVNQIDVVSIAKGKMRIVWDAALEMDDGTVLRADIFLPEKDSRYPVLLTLGPYAKGLSFQNGYKGGWDRMVAAYPETKEGTTAKFANWELVDPEKWTPEGYVCLHVDGRRSGRSPGTTDLMSPREIQDFHDCIEWAASQPWCNGKVGINIRHPGERFTTRDEQEWPLARTQWTRYYLDPQKSLLMPGPKQGGSIEYEAMGDGLTFSLPVSDKEVEITGSIAARLFVSSETTDADLFLALRLFDADGREVLFIGTNDPRVCVELSWLRASLRKLDAEQSLPYRPSTRTTNNGRWSLASRSSCGSTSCPPAS